MRVGISVRVLGHWVRRYPLAQWHALQGLYWIHTSFSTFGRIQKKMCGSNIGLAEHAIAHWAVSNCHTHCEGCERTESHDATSHGIHFRRKDSKAKYIFNIKDNFLFVNKNMLFFVLFFKYIAITKNNQEISMLAPISF